MKTFYKCVIIQTLLATMVFGGSYSSDESSGDSGNSDNSDLTFLEPNTLLDIVQNNTAKEEIERRFQLLLNQNDGTFTPFSDENDWSRILSNDLLGRNYVIAVLQWDFLHHFMVFQNPSEEDVEVQIEFPVHDNYSYLFCPESSNHIMLHAGQVQVLNFTCNIGAYVKSPEDISVFSMSISTWHDEFLIEQLLPLNLWGTYYVVKPYGDANVIDIILILTAKDSTNVHILGYDYVTLPNKYDRIQRRIMGTSPVTIKSSKPVSVTQFFLSKGNSSMVSIIPVKYRIDKSSIEGDDNIQFGYLHTESSIKDSITVPLTEYYRYKQSDYSAMPKSVLSCTMWNKEKSLFPRSNCGYLNNSQTETLWPVMIPGDGIDNDGDGRVDDEDCFSDILQLSTIGGKDCTQISDNLETFFVIPIIEKDDASLSCHADNVATVQYYNTDHWVMQSEIHNFTFPTPMGKPILIKSTSQNDIPVDMLLCQYKLPNEVISNKFLVPSLRYLQTEYVVEFPSEQSGDCMVASVFKDTGLTHRGNIVQSSSFSQQLYRGQQGGSFIAASHIISVQCYITDDHHYYVHHAVPNSGNRFSINLTSSQPSLDRRLLITSTDSNTVLNVSTRYPGDCGCNSTLASSLHLLIDTAGSIHEHILEDENVFIEITSNRPVTIMLFLNMSTSGASSSFRYDSFHLSPYGMNDVWNEQDKSPGISNRKREYGLVSYQVPGDGVDNDQDGLVDEEYCGFLWEDYQWLDLDLDGSVHEDCKGCFGGQELTVNFICQTCNIGYYREESSAIDVCIDCGQNMTTFHEGSNSSSDCIPLCEEGMQLNNTTEACEPCPVGFYKESANETDRFWCKMCPENKTTYDTGASSVQQCIDHCDVGMYFDGNICQQCDLGFYKNTSSRNIHLEESLRWNCTQCPPRKTTNSTGADKCIDICPEGMEINPTSGVCNPCKLGFFKNITGNHVECYECPVNYTTRHVGATSLSQCKLALCEEGMQLNNTTEACEPCPVGFYKESANETDNIWCKMCPENKTTYDTGASSVQQCIDHCDVGMYFDGIICQQCDLGFYKNTSSRNIHLEENLRWNCTQCPPRKTTNSTGADKCIDICPEGMEINPTSGVCNPCKLGVFKNITGNHVECYECPVNYTTRHVGATSLSQCKLANCMCPCSRVNTPKNLTDEQIAEAIRSIKKKLLINVTKLSSTLRKKISVMDSRPSSQSIGALGALVIASIFVVLFAFDFSILVGHIRASVGAFRALLRALPQPR